MQNLFDNNLADQLQGKEIIRFTLNIRANATSAVTVRLSKVYNSLSQAVYCMLHLQKYVIGRRQNVHFKFWQINDRSSRNPPRSPNIEENTTTPAAISFSKYISDALPK